jgi:hypothetical protein
MLDVVPLSFVVHGVGGGSRTLGPFWGSTVNAAVSYSLLALRRESNPHLRLSAAEVTVTPTSSRAFGYRPYGRAFNAGEYSLVRPEGVEPSRPFGHWF